MWAEGGGVSQDNEGTVALNDFFLFNSIVLYVHFNGLYISGDH